MPPSVETYVRAYPVRHHANAGKIDHLRELLPLWQRGCQHLVNWAIPVVQSGAHLPKFIHTQDLPTYLSARQWRSVWNQVRASLVAWLGNLKRIVRSYLQHSTLDGDLAVECFRLNAGRMWWVKDHKDFSDEALRLSRALVKQAIGKCPPPQLSRVRTMVMDGLIAEYETPQTSTFDGWLRFSTARKRKTVRVPFHEPSHAHGEATSVVQVTIGDDVVIRRTYRSELAPERDSGRELGLDWGMRSLFATSDGRLVGLHLFDWLKARDAELDTLTRALGRNRVKYNNSARYRALNNRIHSHVTNEVNRVLNRLASDDVAVLVVESLDFRHGDLSKRMNRLVTRAGRGAVTRKLESLTQERGIHVVAVNPAYTSQECSGCGYIDKSNRSGVKFKCRFCHKQLQADINGARVIVRRRSAYANGLSQMSIRQVRQARDLAFQKRWACASLDNYARTAGLGPPSGPELNTSVETTVCAEKG